MPVRFMWFQLFRYNVAYEDISKKHVFHEAKWKFSPTKFCLPTYFFISYLIKGTAPSCLLLLSGIMETHRAISIEDLDLQVFDLSMRQIIWIRYWALMGVSSLNGQYVVTRLFTFASDEVILMIQLRMFQLWSMPSVLCAVLHRAVTWCMCHEFSCKAINTEKKDAYDSDIKKSIWE